MHNHFPGYPAAKTLYVSDLDGTLLNAAAEVTAFSKEALNRMLASGLRFTTATARTQASALKILSGVDLPLPVILMNGAVIYDTAAKKAVKISPLAPKAVERVTAALRQAEASALMYACYDDCFCTYYETLSTPMMRDFVEERKRKYYKTFQVVTRLSDVPTAHIVYFAVLDTYSRIQTLYDALAGLSGIQLYKYKDVYQSDAWFLEISDESVSKRNAVQCIKAAYDFAYVVGFGDNFNDLPLFEACDYRLAMENACDALKEAADEVIGHHRADGVVRWLMQNALA